MSSELEARLACLAGHGKTVTYGALARDLGLRMTDLTQALEILMDTDTQTDRPLRAALCEGRMLTGAPARGFFDKARSLGHSISDEAAFVAAQRQAVFAQAGREDA